jgi:hypothetical protein
MRRSHTFVLVLVTVVLGGAISTASALAEPEFLTKAVVGETAPIVEVEGSSGVALLETKGGGRIECGKSSLTGDIAGARLVEGVSATFKECKTSTGFPCENAGVEEIQSKPLVGLLNGITATLPGLRLLAQNQVKNEVVAEFTCAGAAKVIVRGAVIGSLSGAQGSGPATGKLLPESKLAFAESKGVQKYTKFIEGPEKGQEQQLEESFMGAAFELAGASADIVLKSKTATLEFGITK